MRFLCAMLLLTSTVSAQITAPKTVAEHEPIIVKIKLPDDAGSRSSVIWSSDERSKFVAVAGGAHVWAGPGAHWIKATVNVVHVKKIKVLQKDENEPENIAKAREIEIEIFIGQETIDYPSETFTVTQGPRPPPDPKPEPKPPDPPPQPDKISVLIVEDSDARSQLPPGQHDAMFAADVRSYLDRVCAKSPDNHPEWRVWDVDDASTHTSERMRNAWAAFKALDADKSTPGIQKPALPVVLISDGVKGTAESVPTSKAAMLTLLKRWGGP